MAKSQNSAKVRSLAVRKAAAETAVAASRQLGVPIDQRFMDLLRKDGKDDDGRMQFNYEAHSAKLELRIMELEDTVRALATVAKTTADLVSSLNEIMNHYADVLGGVMLAMPSVVQKLPMWPVAAHPGHGNGGSTGLFDTSPAPDGE